MQQTFNHILTFLFNHNYFSDKLFKSLEITLGEETSKLTRDLGIIIKPFPGGLHLLASDVELLKNNDETVPIRLNLFCKDNLYINYTELPNYNPSDNILYFNNLTENSGSSENSFYVHNTEFTGETEIVQLCNGRINISSFSADKKYLFTDVAGAEISSHNIRQSKTIPGEFILSNLSEGLVRIKENGAEISRIYYNPKQIWKKPIGIIEIFTDILYNQFTEKGKVEYLVNFNNRETIWKYFLVDPVYQKFNNLSIINKGKEKIFGSPVKQLINQNLGALVFESINKIPLSELSEENYQLVDNYDNGSGKGKIILKNLARPSPEQLFRDENRLNETIYSHIYI